MKNVFKTISLFACVALLAVSCSKANNAEYTPGENFPENSLDVFFSGNNKSTIEIAPEDTKSFKVTVNRLDASLEESNIKIVKLEVDDVFQGIPETISFAEGQDTETFTVTYDDAALGKYYTLRLGFEGAEVSNPYKIYKKSGVIGSNELRVSLLIIDWQPVEKAIYTDGALTGISTVPEISSFYVNAEIATIGETGEVRVRIRDPYKTSVSSPKKDEFGIYPCFPYASGYSTANGLFTFQVLSASEVKFPICDAGLTWPGLGKITMGSAIYKDATKTNWGKATFQKEDDDSETLTKIDFIANTVFIEMSTGDAGKPFVGYNSTPCAIYFSLKAWFVDYPDVDPDKDKEEE